MSTGRVRAVAVGYQGFGNLGDEAILLGIEELLEGTPIDVVTVVGGAVAPIPAFPHASRILRRRMVPGLAGLRAIRRADALVFSGGGLLHDHWPLVVPQYLAWTVLAKIARRRVAWIGLGIGPLRWRRSRMLTSVTLRLADVVLVRDDASADLARALGRPADATMPDAALFVEGSRPAGHQDPPSQRLPLGLVVRAPLDADRDLETALTEALATVAVRTWRSSGRRAVVLTFAGARDRRFATIVAERVAALGTPVSTEALGPEPRAAIEALHGLSAVVSVRLHGIILAAVAGVPSVGIAYDDKVAAMSEQLGGRDIVVPLRAVTPDALEAALGRAESPEQRAITEQRLQALRDQRGTIARLLVEHLAS